MKSIKRTLRLMALILIIALACVLPVPLNLYRKDNSPKHLIEQIDTKKNDDGDDETKVLFG